MSNVGSTTPNAVPLQGQSQRDPNLESDLETSRISLHSEWKSKAIYLDDFETEIPRVRRGKFSLRRDMVILLAMLERDPDVAHATW